MGLRRNDARLSTRLSRTAPGALDTHDEARFAGTIFHTVEERARCARILASGWHDLFRERHPEAREYRKKQDGLTASDHAPVMVDLAD